MVWIYDFIDDGKTVTFKYTPENSGMEGVLQYDRTTDDFTLLKESGFSGEYYGYIHYAKRGFREMLNAGAPFPEDPTKKICFMWY